MLDPLLMEDDLSAAHHRAVLVALLAQGQHGLALKYTRVRRPPVITSEDISLHISVLLSNGAIQEAFTFQRSRRSSNLLPVFYSRAEELGKLDSVLQLSLTTQEEKEFVSFLQSSRRHDSQEVLLMYYLQRSRFTEAMQLNLRLKSLGAGSSGARDAIMARYSDILPGAVSPVWRPPSNCVCRCGQHPRLQEGHPRPRAADRQQTRAPVRESPGQVRSRHCTCQHGDHSIVALSGTSS